MPRISLNVDDKVHAIWSSFLKSQQAGRLREAGVLDDWVILGFLHHVDRFIQEGGPRMPERDEETEREETAARARRRLTKQQKRVLPMFDENDRVSTPEISRMLGILPEDGERLVHQWVEEGFLSSGHLRDGETVYTLGEQWLTHNLAANRPSLFAPRSPFILKDSQKK